MDVRDIILFLITVINLFLSGVILFRNPKDKVSRYYSLTVFFVACWTFGIAMFRLSDFSYGLYWAVFYYISAALIATYFLYFAFVFPEDSDKRISYFKHFLMHIPVIIAASVLIFNTSLFVESYKLRLWGKEIKLGPAYYFYILHFVGYMAAAFVVLIKKFRFASEIQKVQLKFILFGTAIATVLGVIFNLFMPLINYKLIWLGPCFTLAMVIAISYAVLKHHLFNIKVIATELFSAVLVIILFIKFLLSESLDQFILNGIIVAAFLCFSYLLIKGVLKEVKTREEMEELALKLKKANERLLKLDEEKSDFISIASHQLRTPLTAIKGYASMILEGTFGKIPSKSGEAVKAIFESSQRLILIISDFLDIDRIEAGKIKYSVSSFDLRETIENIINEFKIITGKTRSSKKVGKLDIFFEFDKDKDFTVVFDFNKIRQVVSNLIDNAVKYTRGGFIKVFLSQKTDASGELKFLIKIQDSGNGISQEMLPKLFQKFVRANTFSSPYASGSGLGLYVVRKIVEAHGGKIWAESEGIGKGSSFYVELPAKTILFGNKEYKEKRLEEFIKKL